jgi:SAM-dependent methyltransferase
LGEAVRETPDEPRRFDRFAAEYDFAARCWRDHAFFLDRLPPRRRSALDVGCGSGGLAEALTLHFDDVRGVDLCEPLLDIARARCRRPSLEYVRGDAERAEGLSPPTSGGWDLIVSHTLLHPVADPPALAAQLASFLAPGGRLLLVDHVSWRAALPRIVFAIGADEPAGRRARARGGDAGRSLRFGRSRPWLDPLSSDRSFTEPQFRARYGAALPGARARCPHAARRRVHAAAMGRAARRAPGAHRARRGRSGMTEPSNAPTGSTAVFVVSDITASLDHYVNALGFDRDFVYGEPPFYAGVHLGDVAIHFQHASKTSRPAGGACLYLYVPDAVSMHADLSRRGARVTGTPAPRDYGLVDFTTDDPDGNQLVWASDVETEA